MHTSTATPRIGARTVLRGQADRVLLIHDRTPTMPITTDGSCSAEASTQATLTDTAIREVAEATGFRPGHR